MAQFIFLLSFLIFSATISTFCAQDQEKQCDYVMTVNTGPTGGPTYKLRTILEAVGGDNIETDNLIKNWGAMDKPRSKYFLPNSSDTFKYYGRCLQYSFCSLVIIGKKGELNPHWYINNITVVTSGEGIRTRYKEFVRFGEEITSMYPGVGSGECGDLS